MKNKNLNKYSITSDSYDIINNQLRGLFASNFGSDASNYATKLCLDSFNTNQPQVCLFVINHSLKNSLLLNLGGQDENGRTILHWLVIFSAKNNEAKQLLFDLLNNIPSQSSDLNKQDKDGNTVAHLALSIYKQNNVNMDDVISFLEKKGVDLSIVNNKGDAVGLSSISEQSEENQDLGIFAKKNKRNTEEKRETIESEIEEITRKIANQFVVNTEKEDATETIDFGSLKRDLDDTEIKQMGGNCDSINSEQLINQLLETFNVKSSINKVSKSFKKNNLIGGETGIRRKLSYSEKSDKSLTSLTSLSNSSKKTNDALKFYDAVKQMGGINVTSDISSISNLDSSLELMSETSMLGSAKKSSSSSSDEKSSSSSDDDTSSTSTSDVDSSSSSDENDERENYSSYSGGELEIGTDEVMEKYGLSKLGRFKNDESSKRHEESIKRIIENLKVDELTAKVYKAMLWKKIRDENKEMRNDDMSKELEKQSSDKKKLETFIKSLDKAEVEKLKTIISEKMKERESENKKENKKEGKKEDKKLKKEDKKISRFLKELSEELENSVESEDEYTSD